jgi:class 3 adenylate cyclase/predicted ATPase/energy-coupling factor transporter ATP-binding protein EcfA2
VTGDIKQWLEGLGLGQYARAFAENDINIRVLPHLSDDDLKELGLTLGHRRTLQIALKEQEEAKQPIAPPADEETVHAGVAHEAERRQITVVFSDLVGSTELSAKLDPEDMREVLRAYQQACSKVIDRYEGYVAKFMGDGLYAYFGYPTAHEDDAERAITAGLGIVEAVAKVGRDLAVRIGIATSNVAVGDLIGEGASEEANVVGEAPNLAARLQGVAEPNSVVIGEATHTLAGGMFETQDLGVQDLKGFSNSMRAWAVLHARATESRFQATRGEHLTELVGREEELEMLRRRWQQAKEGEGQVVLVSGEPGIGKSRLVHAFRASISDEPTHIRLLQCSQHHNNSAMFPFLEPALSAIGITTGAANETKLDKLDAWIRAADQDPNELAPIFGSFLNIDTTVRYPPIDLPPQLQKTKLFDAFSQRLLRVSKNQGLVFVVEDAHWIDPSTVELLSMHIEQAQEQPNVMIIVTYRPEFDAPWVGQPHATLLALNRLSRRECATLVTNVNGAKSLRPELIDQISERTDGIPLFVEELTKVVLETSGKDSNVTTLNVPATLHDSLVARLDALGTTRELAQVAACIGRSFSSWLLAAVQEIPEGDLDDALGPLIESGLVYPDRQRDGSGYTFKHVMVQQAAYAGLLRTTRRKIHDRIAATLIEQYDHNQNADLIGIAQHLLAANDIGRALLWFLRAAEHAKNVGSIRESLEIINRAFDLLEKFDGTKEERNRAELELLVAKLPVITAMEGYASEEINQISSRALELAIALGDRTRESTILYQIATVHEVRGEFSQTQATLARRNQIIEEPSHPAPVVENGELMACSTFYEGRFDTSIEHAKQALEYADPEKPSVLGTTLAEEPTIACLFWMAKALLLQGWIDQSRVRHQAAFDCASRSPHWYAQSQAEIDAALLCAFQRDFGAALNYAELAIESSAQVGLAYREAVARLIVEWAHAVGEGVPPNTEQMNKSLSVFRNVGAMIGYPFYLSLVAEAQATVANFEHSEKLIQEALEISGRSRGFFYESELYRLKGELKLHNSGEKEISHVEKLFHKAIDVAHAQGARLLGLRSANTVARLWIDGRQRNEARDLLAPAYNWFTEGFDAADLKEAKALLDELR